MQFQLEYKQTPHERYNTAMNERVRQLLEDADIEITEEYGGSGIGSDMDELVAENGFVVDVGMPTLNLIAPMIQDIVGRDINVTEFVA